MMHTQMVEPRLADRPEAPGHAPRPPRSDDEPSRISAALPPDLLEQVRGRVRVLAGFFVFAFGFDLLLFVGFWVYSNIKGAPLPPDTVQSGTFQWLNLGAVLASCGLWWAAHRQRVSPSLLHTIGLAYQVALCFTIAIITFWQYFIGTGFLPNMTWIPAVVIMFPLIMPGPPRRMLAAALAAAAMSPVALGVLELTGKVQVPDHGEYFRVSFAPFAAAAFAYFGARVIYGLGREVVRARELGSYQLGELLGRGGMGEVYKATHRMLARPAAIKLIRPEMAGGENGGAQLALVRFRREAEVAASLRSPHTVELYDFGVTQDQTFYFVMELLEGMDLESLVRETGPVPAARVIHILRQVCESLAEAHARNLVHRDIKPANIHVGRLGLTYDFVKVLDFGLVKSVSTAGSDQSLATAAGLVAGTPAYMAPEMALGERFDGRADLYALGCVAYYLLSGQLVFEASNGFGMITKHMRDTPVPPSERVELPIPAGLEQLVLACLAKDPEQRPRSALEFSRSLAAVDLGSWSGEQAMQWWSVNRGAVALPQGM
ncbi:MAG: serine/threonine-protein kinase [Gemmatimonadales bacterium]